MASPGAVETASRLAHDYYRRGDIAIVWLLRDSGHRDEMGDVIVDEIAECLRAHLDWREAWIDYSGDQRGGRWFVNEDEAGGCVFGEVLGGTRVYYDDCSVACAEFVRRAVQQIASSTFAGLLRGALSWTLYEAPRELLRRHRRRRTRG